MIASCLTKACDFSSHLLLTKCIYVGIYLLVDIQKKKVKPENIDFKDILASYLMPIWVKSSLFDLRIC